MKNKHIDDPLDVFGDAYELMLERILAGLEEAKEAAHEAKEKAEPLIHRMIEAARKKAVELDELEAEEADKLGEILKHDLIDAAAWKFAVMNASLGVRNQRWREAYGLKSAGL